MNILLALYYCTDKPCADMHMNLITVVLLRLQLELISSVPIRLQNLNPLLVLYCYRPYNKPWAVLLPEPTSFVLYCYPNLIRFCADMPVEYDPVIKLCADMLIKHWPELISSVLICLWNLNPLLALYCCWTDKLYTDMYINLITVVLLRLWFKSNKIPCRYAYGTYASTVLPPTSTCLWL
jgi:hypothetical protein